MTALLSSSWSETATRLAIGIEPRDAATGERVRRGVLLRMETNAAPIREWAHFGGADTLTDLLPDIAQHSSNRFAVTMAMTEGRPPADDFVVLRLVDHHRWYVPRRFEIALADHAAIIAQELDPAVDPPPAANRVVRPLLFPGSAHPRSPRATGIVGRVLRNGAPLRWARVRVDDRRTDRTLLVAHGDDRGEFTALIGAGLNGALPTGPIGVRIHVFGPAVEPSSAGDPDRPAVDPLWDLPLEDLPVPARGVRPDVEDGTAMPAGYVESDTGPTDLDLPLGVVRSGDVPDLIFTAP